MIKTLTSFLDYAWFAEASLLMFTGIFIVVVVRTLLTGREIAEHHANIVLNDSQEAKQ